MTTLFLDCIGGLAGDMMLGLLLDLGLSLDDLRHDLESLPVGEYDLNAERVVKQGIASTYVTIAVGGDVEAAQHARLLHDGRHQEGIARDVDTLGARTQDEGEHVFEHRILPLAVQLAAERIDLLDQG